MLFNKSDELDIQALVDGALDPENEKRVQELIAHSRAHQSRYHNLLLQKQLLLSWWASEEDGGKEDDLHDTLPAAAYVQ